MRKTSPTVPVLALGVFGIITTEMGMVGVLPRVSAELGVSPSAAGWLVGVFALVIAVSGPFTTLLTSGIDRKKVLASAIAVFAVSNAVYALTTQYEVMLAFRVVPALFHPVFFAVALATAARTVPAEDATRATTTVFAGVTVGFAFGVPLTSYLAEHLSLAAAFWFGALVNLAAFLGILRFVPPMPVAQGQRLSYADQLGILKRPRIWLTIVSVVLVFAAMFSIYGYFAEFLGQVTHMDGTWVSAMLMAFGIVMILGNFAFGGLLRRGLVRTVVAYPVLCLLVYVLLYTIGPLLAPMVPAVLVWGAVHSGGLVVSQSWLGRDAGDAPEFGNSLFISFSNLGITAGTALGGWVMAGWGTRQLPFTGIGFAVAALIVITLRLGLDRRRGHGRGRGQGHGRGPVSAGGGRGRAGGRVPGAKGKKVEKVEKGGT
ncbi:MFS transporter [Streptomyces sp. ML-6]|uniref:MFS transporter n=1 Tax=Streptomyces sp. ML-6 TaxID=2982693 RepID=UPI0024BF29A0|nr:MFS transporter [Streptomyces sp. ML-6]MDK0519685.1 MFS transporter [Streptomyces sp. ML-6]